ncbi:M48 family metallopeptidase [uncultured Eubacterium sp.]|uniref:M48 family metallopeptidase n=1 Tax=uncultured Eubacterium sp. TaxID=165185 RepID=UPI0025EA6E92|nr:M48 family metallopeptidase [uncultured Eubacterium sp.]
MTLRVIRSARKTIGLQVKEDGEVLLRIPNRLSARALQDFLNREQSWIWQKAEQMQSRIKQREATGATPVGQLSREELEKIKEKIGSRVRYYGKIMGVTVGRITIRNQKTRWGSCSSKGNLNFNYQLYYLPDELLDYVVIHELVHRRHMNHSADFWAEVEKYCPDYKIYRKQLNEYRLTT